MNKIKVLKEQTSLQVIYKECYSFLNKITSGKIKIRNNTCIKKLFNNIIKTFDSHNDYYSYILIVNNIISNIKDGSINKLLTIKFWKNQNKNKEKRKITNFTV